MPRFVSYPAKLTSKYCQTTAITAIHMIIFAKTAYKPTQTTKQNKKG